VLTHTYQTILRLHHTDAAGVLFFAHQFTLIHEAYESMMEAIGFPLRRLLAEKTFTLPIIQAEAHYTHPLFLGDRVTILLTVDQVTSSAFRLHYHLRNQDHLLTGEAKTVHTAIDPANRQKIPLPPELKACLQAST